MVVVVWWACVWLIMASLTRLKASLVCWHLRKPNGSGRQSSSHCCELGWTHPQPASSFLRALSQVEALSLPHGFRATSLFQHSSLLCLPDLSDQVTFYPRTSWKGVCAAPVEGEFMRISASTPGVPAMSLFGKVFPHKTGSTFSASKAALSEWVSIRTLTLLGNPSQSK